MKKTILPVLIILFILHSCETIYNSEECNCIPDSGGSFIPVDLTIEDFRNNVLRKEFNFSSADTSSCYVIYWNDNEKQILTKKTRADTGHSIILLNLEQNKNYSYVIVQELGNRIINKSEVKTFQTKGIPVHYNPYSFNNHSQIYSDTFNEYILTHQRDTSANLLLILNGRGKIIWYQKFTKSPKIFTWTSRGTILCMLSDKASLLLESDEILEINLYGDTLTNIHKGSETFNKGLHHDIIRNSVGNIYAINYDYRIIDFSPLGHNETDTVFCDGITELDQMGNKVWEWSVFDAVNPLEDPEVYVRRNDWLHANSICEDADNNIIVSFRHNSQIWKIDKSTGEIIWKFGNNGDFDLPLQSTFSGQHHVTFSSTGDLLIFDNNNESSRSRILYYSINESLMNARLTRKINLPAHYYTYIMGSVFETQDQNLLVNSTSAGAISLIDYSGSIIWEINTGAYPYRAVLVKNLNNNYEYCSEQ